MDFANYIEMKWKIWSFCRDLGHFQFKIENIIESIIPSFHFCDFYLLEGYFEDDRFNDIINVVIDIYKWCICKKRRNNLKYENDIMSERVFF